MCVRTCFSFAINSRLQISPQMNEKEVTSAIMRPPAARKCFVRCPYDNRHFVLQQNYEAHLPACAQKHPDKNVLFCPFNTSHRCTTLEALVKARKKTRKSLCPHDLLKICSFCRANTSTNARTNNHLATIDLQLKLPSYNTSRQCKFNKNFNL